MLWPVPGTIIIVGEQQEFTSDPVAELLPPPQAIELIAPLRLSYFKAPRRPRQQDDEAATRLLTTIAITYAHILDLEVLYTNLAYLTRWLITREAKLCHQSINQLLAGQDAYLYVCNLQMRLINQVLVVVHFDGDVIEFDLWSRSNRQDNLALYDRLEEIHRRHFAALSQLPAGRLITGLPRLLRIAPSCDPLLDPTRVIPELLPTNNYYH